MLLFCNFANKLFLSQNNLSTFPTILRTKMFRVKWILIKWAYKFTSFTHSKHKIFGKQRDKQLTQNI